MANARTERSVHMRLIDWARSLTKHRMLVGPGNRYVRAGAGKCAHRLASHARVETDRGAWGFASMIKADVMSVDKPQPPPEQREPPVSERLDSWKEIAAYLKRDESTARRWEKEGLPVHRHAHKKKATICAYTSELGKISTLRTLSYRSAIGYRQTAKPLSEIARELKVDALLDGAVVRSGDRVRITANLVEAVPERHLLAETYEFDSRDVLAVQGAVARDVARKIRVKVTAEEQARLTTARRVDPEAYEAYLLGRAYFDKIPAES